MKALLRISLSCAITFSILLSPGPRQSWAQGKKPPEAGGVPDGKAVIDFLNQSIDWHRQLGIEQQLATDPADVLFLNDARQLANQALQLSFDFAKADAQLLAKQNPPAPSTDDGELLNTTQSLAQEAAAADAEVRERQADLQSLKAQSARAPAGKRRLLQAQIDALQSELELEQTRSQSLRELLQFGGGRGSAAAGGSLVGQIDELQRSVPELEANNAPGKAAPANAGAAPAQRTQPSGIVGLVEDLMALQRKKSTINGAIAATDALSQTAEKLRAPVVATLTAIEEQGDQALRPANASDPAQLETEKNNLDALNARFKQLSATALPLGKQAVLLRAYRTNLQQWRETVDNLSGLDTRRLLVRLAILGAVVILVIALAEIWRKAIFRYVHDVRRRYQFLVLRRIVIWIAIAIAVAFALASEIGSLATFVGLITAGIAVALQNVIMAVAGYFFLIGKYGVRVGDRVQIGGVTGDVIDIGLVRLHLMEVGDTKSGRQPTGRVVVFSNAIVFQPGASFYKQIPGTSFTWHQVTMTLAPNTDYGLAEKRMLEAVESVYASYKPRIEEQHRHMQETLSVSVDLPKPVSRLQFTDGGLEVVIRYPTEVDNAARIDDQVTRRLLQAIEQSPRLRLVGSGTPNIQPVTEAPESKAPESKAS